MCYSPEISILTFVIGIIGCIYLYIKGHYVEAIFLGWIINMQLIDFFLWHNQPCSDETIVDRNISISKIGLILNHTQPIIFWIALKYYTNNNNIYDYRELPALVDNFIILFLIITLFYTFLIFDVKCTEPTERSKPYLEWDWNNRSFNTAYYGMFLASIMMLCYYGFPDKIAKESTLLIIGSFLYSFIIYGDKYVAGNMWCYFAAFFPWIIIYLYSI